MKSSLTVIIAAGMLLFATHSFTQDDHAVALPAPSDGKAASSTNPEMSSKEQDAHTAEEDDALYRGKTGEMETTLMRDDGALHFKTHGREKVQEVDAKNLRSNRIDTKFQGNLLHDSLTSIEDVGAKSAEETQVK